MSKYEEQLIKLGIAPNVLGFHYLYAACKLVENNPRISITKELYPYIAKTFKSTPSKVERCIRHVRDTIFNKNKPEDLYKYFGNTIDPVKGTITNAQMIHMIVYNKNKE